MLKTIAAFDRIGEENAFAVLARANALQAQGRDIISLGIGQPDFRTPDFIVEAAIKALRDGHHGYTPANGIPQLREAVAADLHKRFKVEVSPDSVMIMPGGKPTMFMSILMFGEPGVDILYPDPGFPIYRSMIEYTGARPIPVPIREENGFAFSADETLKLITPQTRLLIINSPANPTGGVTPKAEIDKLVAGLEKFPDVCIMSDEIYDHMVYDGEQHVCLLSYPSIRDRLILLNGWSKTYAMTGWRVGWVVGPADVVKAATNLQSHATSNVANVSQAAAIAALTGDLSAVASMREAFDRRRRTIVSMLREIPGVACPEPQGAFYVYPSVKGLLGRSIGGRTAETSVELAELILEQAEVAVVPGEAPGGLFAVESDLHRAAAGQAAEHQGRPGQPHGGPHHRLLSHAGCAEGGAQGDGDPALGAGHIGLVARPVALQPGVGRHVVEQLSPLRSIGHRGAPARWSASCRCSPAAPRTTPCSSASPASARPPSSRAWPRRSTAATSRRRSGTSSSTRWTSAPSWPAPATAATSRSA